MAFQRWGVAEELREGLLSHESKRAVRSAGIQRKMSPALHMRRARSGIEFLRGGCKIVMILDSIAIQFCRDQPLLPTHYSYWLLPQAALSTCCNTSAPVLPDSKTLSRFEYTNASSSICELGTQWLLGTKVG